MARLQIHAYEPDVEMDAVVPEYMNSPKRFEMSSEEYYSQTGKSLPVLWLLHDLGGNYSDWLRYSQAELFAEKAGIIIVCPGGENGFWTNMDSGVGWKDIFEVKLWPMVHKLLPTSDKRENNFIAGVGMGGYGAIKLALDFPQYFAGAAAFNGWLDAPLRQAEGKFPEKLALYETFGNNGVRAEDDLEWLLENNVAAGRQMPEIYLDCCEQTEFIDSNRAFAQKALSEGYDVKQIFGPGKDDWSTANEQLEIYISHIFS